MAKQLEYLELEPGRDVQASKKKIVNYYLDKYLPEVLKYYQSGVEVVNPLNKKALTTQVNSLSGVWDLRDIDGLTIPPTVTKSFHELIRKFSKVTVA